jgi:hypothetical protein
MFGMEDAGGGKGRGMRGLCGEADREPVGE